MNAVATKRPRAPKEIATRPEPVIAPVQVVARAIAELVQQAKERYEGPLESPEVCVHAHTLVDMALEEVLRLESGQCNDESESVHRIAACLAGSLAHDMTDAPASIDRHAALLQAYDTAESAAISFGFTEEPCVGMAKGIKAGQAMAATRPQAAKVETSAQRAAGLDDRIDPYTAILNARDCAGMLANSAGTDVMWALNSLIHKAADMVEAAQNAAEAGQYSEADHEDASNELAGVLGLVGVLDNGADPLLNVVETLLTVCKREIDRTIHEALIAGRAQ